MFELSIASNGLDTAIDVTDTIADGLREHAPWPGMATIFLRGSSVGLVAMRFEPGTVRDLLEALEGVAPVGKTYAHELTTGDRNGFAHIRSSLLGTSLNAPWTGEAFDVSSSHRFVLFDFDLKPAQRTIVVSCAKGHTEP